MNRTKDEEVGGQLGIAGPSFDPRVHTSQHKIWLSLMTFTSCWAFRLHVSRS
jgi:hypothetical protein